MADAVDDGAPRAVRGAILAAARSTRVGGRSLRCSPRFRSDSPHRARVASASASGGMEGTRAQRPRPGAVASKQCGGRGAVARRRRGARRSGGGDGGAERGARARRARRRRRERRRARGRGAPRRRAQARCRRPTRPSARRVRPSTAPSPPKHRAPRPVAQARSTTPPPRPSARAERRRSPRRSLARRRARRGPRAASSAAAARHDLRRTWCERHRRTRAPTANRFAGDQSG